MLAKGEGVLVGVLLATMAALLWVGAPARMEGPDWRTFQRLGPLSRDVNYWLTPGAFDGNYWSVGYSAFVGVFLPTSDSSTTALEVAHASLALTLSLMVYAFTFRFGRLIRLLATTTCVLSPTIYWMTWNGGYELLLGWLTCLSVLLLWLQIGDRFPFRRSSRGLLSFTSGFLISLAALVASKLIFLIVLLVIVLFIMKFQAIRAYIVGTLIPLIVWSLRNLLVLGTISPLNSNGPVNLWIGNNPDAVLGGFMEPPPLPPGTSTQLEAAMQTIISFPEFFVSLTLRKATRLLEPNYIYPDHVLPPEGLVGLHFLTAAISLVLVALFMIYAGGRLWVSAPTVPPVGLLAIVYIGFLILHIPFLAEARFRAPLEPILISVAIPTAFYLTRRWRTTTRANRIHVS